MKKFNLFKKSDLYIISGTTIAVSFILMGTNNFNLSTLFSAFSGVVVGNLLANIVLNKIKRRAK